MELSDLEALSQLVFRPGSQIEDLELLSEGQVITVNGFISPSYSDTLIITANNVSIASLTELLESEGEFDGRINATVAKLSGVMSGPRMQAMGRVKNFKYKQIKYVDIDFQTFWQSSGPSRFIGANTTWSYLIR